jgi:hypothetical protein
MATIIFEPFDESAKDCQTYTGPFDENAQMLVDVYCLSDQGTVTIYTDDGQTIYQHQALYSLEEKA